MATMKGGVHRATKGMAYNLHSGSNLQTVQFSDKAVSSATATAATVHHSQRPACQAEVLWIICLV